MWVPSCWNCRSTEGEGKLPSFKILAPVSFHYCLSSTPCPPPQACLGTGLQDNGGKKEKCERFWHSSCVLRFPLQVFLLELDGFSWSSLSTKLERPAGFPSSILGKALGGHLEMLLAVREQGRWAVQACPLHGCSCVWKPSSEHALQGRQGSRVCIPDSSGESVLTSRVSKGFRSRLESGWVSLEAHCVY